MKISYEGAKPSDAVMDEALHRAARLRHEKDASGLQRMSRAYDLADGTQVYVHDLEHVRMVHVVGHIKPEKQTSELSPTYVREYPIVGVADFVSGAVTNHFMRDENIALPWEKEPSSRRVIKKLWQTARSEARFSDGYARYKINQRCFGGFELPKPENTDVSQHHDLKPGYYSGKMRGLVQLLLGVGRVAPVTVEQNFVDEDPENRDFTPLSTLIEEGGGSAFGLFNRPSEATAFELQVRYDYRFNRTHGLAWDGDGKCYLVEIASRGVHVMPLPLDPVSMDEMGRARYHELYPELSEFMAVLGGFPTGATFPTLQEDLDKALLAGDVVQILSRDDMSVFYQHQMYSSAMGWAFNESGTEAHNTCFSSDGVSAQVGYHYAVNFSVAKRTLEPVDDEVFSFIVSMLEIKPGSLEERKARRLSTDPANKDILRQGITSMIREWFDTAQAPTDFAASGRIGLRKRGLLWHYADLYSKSPSCDAPSPQDQYKVAEPLLGGCVSFDFRSGIEFFNSFCDTPILVYFQGDTLKVLNYALYPQQGHWDGENSSTQGECQVFGSWTTISSAGGVGLFGTFYSNDADWREDLYVGSYSKTVTHGEEVGRTNYVQFCFFFATDAMVVREVYGTYDYETESHTGKSKHVGIIQPLGERSGYYVAASTHTVGESFSKGGGGVVKVGNTDTYRIGSIYDFIWHWVGCGLVKQRGEGPVCRFIEDVNSPLTASPPGCLGDEPPEPFDYDLCPSSQKSGNGIIYSKRWPDIPKRPAPSSTSTPSVNVTRSFIWAFGNAAFNGKEVKKTVLEDDEGTSISNWWRKPSPDKCDNYAKMYMNHSYLGLDCLSVQDDVEGKTVYFGLGDERQLGLLSTYVGVME